MAVTPQPDLLFTATLIDGFPTVTFPSVPYPRLISSIWMRAGVKAGATIYRGQIAAPGLKDSVSSANPITYNIPFLLPSGQALFVVFSASPNPVSLASARLSAQRSDSGYV